jgi:hypothetical protein
LLLNVVANGAAAVLAYIVGDLGGGELEAVADRDGILGLLDPNAGAHLLLPNQRPVSSYIDDVAAWDLTKAEVDFGQSR